VLSLGRYQKTFIIPSRHQRGTLGLFQAISLELPSPDALARGNLLLEHRAIVSELQRHLCVSEGEKLADLCLVLMMSLLLGKFGSSR
jgi:hypothetical protein